MAEGDSQQIQAKPAALAPGASAISRGRMALLFMVMLVTAAGNTAMQSVMPSIGTELGVADVWISLAYSWSAILWVIAAPIWARRSDHRGRKAMMALGMVGFIISMVLCGAVLWLGLAGWLTAFWTLALFALARGLYGGFGSAAPPAVQAYVAARTGRAQRTQALSLLSSSFGLGTVIGPALAPLLIFPFLGLTGPFAAYTLIGLVALVLLRLRLPNDEPRYQARGANFTAPYGTATTARTQDEAEPGEDDEEDDEDGDPDGALPVGDQPKLRWTNPRVRPWVTAGLLGGHAHAMILGIAGFLVLDRLGLRADPMAGTGPVGLVLMCGAIATLLAQWGLIPVLALGPRAATLWGIVVAAGGTVLFALAQDLHAIAFGFAIASLGFGLYRPGFTAGTSLAVRRSEQGQASGLVASINGMAYVFAPALGVWLYNHSAWLGFAAIIALCGLVVAMGWRSLQSDETLTGHA